MAIPIQSSLGFSPVISRQEAIARNLKWYFNGEPCRQGHIAERLVSNCKCKICAYERHHKYYANNRDKICTQVREYNRTKDDLNAKRRQQRALREASWSGERRNRHRRQQAANMKANRLKRRVAKAERPKPDRCEVCCKKAKKICFDHCHKTKKFRGWLCERCNFAVGHADDSPELLMRLAEYLRQYQPPEEQAGA